MKTATTAACLLAFFGSLLSAPEASAENTDWEITPTIGYRTSSQTRTDLIDFFGDYEIDESASFGVTVERRLNDNLRLELLWSRQSSEIREDGFLLFRPREVLFDLNVDNYHIGLMYQWNPGKIKPFVVGSLGATRFDPEPSNLDSEDRFSASLGGGAKFMFSDHIGLRLEGRIFSTLLEDEDEFFCIDYCSNSDDYLIQAEARAGLILAF